MGECCAELTYGILINEEDYQKLLDQVYEKKMNGKWPTWHEKDKKSPIKIEQPYETESHLVVVRASGQFCNDGTTPVKTEIGSDWNELLKTFLEKHSINAESEPSWLLVGHYG